MAIVGKEYAIEICRDYLLNLGINEDNLNLILDPDLFKDGFVQNLQKSCIIPKNKPNKNDKTTHIAITGNSRLLFYSENQLKTVGGRDDEHINVDILNVNLAHLLFLNAERIEIPFKFNDTLEIVTSHTVKKISARGNQVQLSKFKYDGERFSDLRKGLYIDDLLVMLKYANSEDSYLAIGVPALEIRDIVPSNYSRQLSSTNAKKIGAYSVDQDRDREVSSAVDLSNATEKRLNRSMRHQALLRKVAVQLESAGYTLYEGMIDCLAANSENTVLIFEMKTLDGTPSDEMNQVRDALGQLLYYDLLQSGQFEKAEKIKIACFEGAISEKHKQLLEQNGCKVIWLDESGEFFGLGEFLGV